MPLGDGTGPIGGVGRGLGPGRGTRSGIGLGRGDEAPRDALIRALLSKESKKVIDKKVIDKKKNKIKSKED